MAQTSAHTAARRALLAMVLITVALVGLLTGAHQWGDARWTPKLGLDLEGGTQMILEPRLTGASTVSAEQIDQARDIIVQRVDAGGISGAEVTTQGGRNIVVSIPGTPTESTLNAIRRSSQMQFRPVLAIADGVLAPTPTDSASPTVDPSASPAPSTTEAPVVSPAPEASPTAQSAIPGALMDTPTPAATDSASPAATPSPSPSASASGSNSSAPDPTSLEWVTPELQTLFAALNCADPGAVDSLIDDPAKPLVTCDQTGAVKYILGPVVVPGSEIQDAAAGYQALPSGQMSNIVEIQLTLKSTGAKEYADISRKMVNLSEPQNQLAATLDSKVIVAPRFNEAILDGRASITGGFTIETARDLAQQLKFGALPISFDLQTREEISPTLGSEQLRYGLLAGLAGLVLVFLYSLAQYRVLGLVTVASIVFAGLLTYLAITILGWSHNYRLDMAGVTGLIIAIGFTADSFIVYFERIRDELRSGRSLESAVATGWNRAKRTILAADGVNFLAAVVLYLLASSGVRGFAFTLGLTTLIDLLVTFLFSHPLVALLARQKFFRDGHPWSGLDPTKLGAQKRTSYAGRGRFVPNPGRAVATTEGSAS
ncbi:MAG TPA: protein translocase subunit SecD [Phycicoccus elongatus]|uniref:protein translocase subunit SecD n=1 Tax=Phycicoccus TaxID=367298 RepID=UPI002590E08E|nr:MULTISPECIES: protein translocase subunit SecD [Phycicoccus]MCB9405484.1 protein translocase subunit SecD [Tetrasphaera sp.]MCO5301772.1 protein translocase subunit SecD [Phycicoccus sp.]HPK12226.1 protein translocase subunit SecD [Phycicoccus elongatus]HPQ73610.1 protein translocase subunit SecD [Phycicoccus elongatus]